MTFFGQFFDHGLDLVTKGGSGTVFMPLQADDPLVPARRASALPMIFRPRSASWSSPAPPTSPGRTACSAPPTTSTSTPTQTSPFVDQNQTYASHPSHQVFLRAYDAERRRAIRWPPASSS
ncbi:MAG: hypothetical protein M0C28_31885 [Candidatus Moduliflexus flocculans]|nr:hypothetical protein [Candidatus Moduliflexus flocculans]